MSLTCGIADAKTVDPYSSISCYFDDDGYYWFCHTDFEELAARTGEMIDLYGGAWFSGPAIDELLRALVTLKQKALAQPDQWQQLVGYSMGSALAPISPPAPIYDTVQRDTLLSLLDQFARLAESARRDGKWVACLGD